WDEHTTHYGPLHLSRRIRPGGDPTLIDAVKRAGLRGRGGAWFPTHLKLTEVAASATRSKPAMVVANGCEGELASAKYHALLSRAPHLVLDGLDFVARAAGTTETVVCLHRGD